MSARRQGKDHTPQVLTETGVIAAAPITIETPQFTGSLPMLFACVRDRKIDLRDIPLLPLCEAYFSYLVDSAETNLDEAAAALAALAYLLERKAWLLLPVEEEPEMLEESMELPDPTAHEYEPAIEALRFWESERAQLFFRPLDAGPDPYELPFELEDVSISDLARALERVLAKARPDPPEILNKPRRNISDQMGIVLRALRVDWTSLEVLLEEPYTRTEAVYWFLALLELIRLGQAKVRIHDGDAQFARVHGG